jgi:hypothetical protein
VVFAMVAIGGCRRFWACTAVLKVVVIVRTN